MKLPMMMAGIFLVFSFGFKAQADDIPWAPAMAGKNALSLEEVRRDKTLTIGGELVYLENISSKQKDLKGNPWKLGYKSDHANETKKFSGSFIVDSKSPIGLALLADDEATIDVYGADKKGGKKEKKMYTMSVHGGALWNPSSYKEDGFRFQPGKKYFLDVTYKNKVHWVDGKSNPPVVDVDGISIYKFSAPSESVIYLTFDDGPYGDRTKNILDVLGKKQIDVTFFVMGKQAKLFPAILQNEIASGYSIGNHSMTHAEGMGYIKYYSKNGGMFVYDEMVLNRKNLENAGIKYHIARLPGRDTTRTDECEITDPQGKEDSAFVADKLKSEDTYVYGWRNGIIFLGSDASAFQNPHKAAAEVISKLKEAGGPVKGNGVLVLMHDLDYHDKANIAKLGDFIDDLKKARDENGKPYKFGGLKR